MMIPLQDLNLLLFILETHQYLLQTQSVDNCHQTPHRESPVYRQPSLKEIIEEMTLVLNKGECVWVFKYMCQILCNSHYIIGYVLPKKPLFIIIQQGLPGYLLQ